MGLVPTLPVISEAGTSVIPDFDRMTNPAALPRFTGATGKTVFVFGASWLFAAVLAANQPSTTIENMDRPRVLARSPGIEIDFIEFPICLAASVACGLCRKRSLQRGEPVSGQGNQLALELQRRAFGICPDRSGDDDGLSSRLAARD